MAGPFPGMDPYLENPVLWTGVHQGLITGLRNILNRLLPAGYVADMGERIYLMQPDRSIYPDVVIFEQPVSSPRPVNTGTPGAAVADPPLILVDEPIEVREVYIEILPVGEETRVVTVIEVLSQVNKARGSEGNALYRAKQQALLHSQVNLIEIDLLRRGEHTVAATREALLRHRRWDYLVCQHRSGDRDRYSTWPRTVRDRLPCISVPLEGELPDVIVDLQEVFDRNYDDAAYGRRVDYTRDPVPALDTADAAWADALLKAAGRRQDLRNAESEVVEPAPDDQ
jgi:hypothetical protein